MRLFFTVHAVRGGMLLKNSESSSLIGTDTATQVLDIAAASNAVNSANMALAGYEHLIPIDQVIAAMDEVGRAMPRELCCTALGGLSITPASKDLEARLDGKPG